MHTNTGRAQPQCGRSHLQDSIRERSAPVLVSEASCFIVFHMVRYIRGSWWCMVHGSWYTASST